MSNKKKSLYSQVPDETDPEAKQRVLDDLKYREQALNGDNSAAQSQKTTASPEKRPPKAKKYPWEQEGISPRVTKSYNLRLKEPDFEKLRFVVENSTDKSINSYVQRVLMQQVEKDLKKMT